MHVTVRGTSYPMPVSDGRSGPTGSEIDTVETYFGVDWYDLMDAAVSRGEGEPAPVLRPGCTRTRAQYALAWIAMHRADASVTLADVMDYGRDEIAFGADPETPAKKGKGAEVPTPAGDEGTESAATS